MRVTVLQEKDEVVTAVRIVDTLYVSIPANVPANTKPVISNNSFCVVQESVTRHRGRKASRAVFQVCAPSGREHPQNTLAR